MERRVEAEFDDDPPLLPPDPALEVDCRGGLLAVILLDEIDDRG